MSLLSLIFWWMKFVIGLLMAWGLVAMLWMIARASPTRNRRDAISSYVGLVTFGLVVAYFTFGYGYLLVTDPGLSNHPGYYSIRRDLPPPHWWDPFGIFR
jgi:hypothetical protein